MTRDASSPPLPGPDVGPTRPLESVPARDRLDSVSGPLDQILRRSRAAIAPVHCTLRARLVQAIFRVIRPQNTYESEIYGGPN